MTNSVILVGCIHTSPRFSYTTNRRILCEFGLQVQREQSILGPKIDVIPVIVWDEDAKIIEKKCTKKTLIMITGKIQMWHNHKCAYIRKLPKVIGDSVTIISQQE